jgi:hypothetical protein
MTEAVTLIPYFVCNITFPVNKQPYFAYSSEAIYTYNGVERSGNVELQKLMDQDYNSPYFISIFGEYNTSQSCTVRFKNYLTDCRLFCVEDQKMYELKFGVCPNFVKIIHDSNQSVTLQFAITDNINPFNTR